MTQYIALLRGINVGGKNKLSMKELKKTLEENGFTRVCTYINSGNIIFSGDSTDLAALTQRFERLILENFQLDLAAHLISADEFTRALSHAPEWWDSDPESKHNAIFVISPMTVESVLEKVGEGKPDVEKFGHCGRVIFWSAPLATFSKTRWSKIVGKSVYSSITIRNANTAKKLAEMCKE